MSRSFNVRSSIRTITAAAAVPVAAGALLAVTATGSSATTTGETGRTKPTIVLVHGAFADGASWSAVIDRLQRDGYPVVATANPLRGLRSDSAYLRSVLKSIKGPKILVGHSYGGSVISQTAPGDKDVKALVFVASFLLKPGESTGELANKYPGNTLGKNLISTSYPLPGGGTAQELTIRQDRYHKHFAADVPAHTARILAAGQRPAAVAALEEKATKAGWKTIPSYVLIAGKDRAIPLKAQRFMAKRAGATTVTLKNASHAVAVSQPGAVADLIRRAARETAR